MRVTNGDVLKMIYGEGVELLGEKRKQQRVRSVGTSQCLAVPNSIQIQIILEHFGGLA